MSVVLIPGNIKQRMLPVQLQPGTGINSDSYENSQAVGSAKPQLFSFRTNSKQEFDGPFGRLTICPSTFASYVKNDAAFQYLFKYDAKTGKVDPSKDITAASIFDSLPCIQIREFLPDTRLEQALNVFNLILQKLRTVFTKTKEDSKTTGNTASTETDKSEQKNDTESFFTKIKETTNWAIDYMTGGTTPNFITDMDGELKGAASPVLNYKEDSYKNYIMRFPYMLYYLFQSSVTTNIYEVPCSLDQYLQSSGHEGWQEGGRLDFVSGLGALGSLGKVASSILGNVSVNYLPFWDSSSGSSTAEPDITIQFDLYNDTILAAVYNYIFVTTLIGNNRWIQYNVFQHSSSLYDVKIEGRQRLFACSANFKVTCKGLMRDIPETLAQLFGQKKFKNSAYPAFDKDILTSKLIKIPDIFTVEMTFKSLLPANFNNFIFSYVYNNQMLKHPSNFGYRKSAAVAAVDVALNKFANQAVEKWDSGYKSKNDGKKSDGSSA